MAAESGDRGERYGSVAKPLFISDVYCQNKKPMKLPLQKI
jgi:hypothetical protein